MKILARLAQFTILGAVIGLGYAVVAFGTVSALAQLRDGEEAAAPNSFPPLACWCTALCAFWGLVLGLLAGPREQ
jgi:hypothetical protein